MLTVIILAVVPSGDGAQVGAEWGWGCRFQGRGVPAGFGRIRGQSCGDTGVPVVGGGGGWRAARPDRVGLRVIQDQASALREGHWGAGRGGRALPCPSDPPAG